MKNEILGSGQHKTKLILGCRCGFWLLSKMNSEHCDLTLCLVLNISSAVIRLSSMSVSVPSPYPKLRSRAFAWLWLLEQGLTWFLDPQLHTFLSFPLFLLFQRFLWPFLISLT